MSDTEGALIKPVNEPADELANKEPATKPANKPGRGRPRSVAAEAAIIAATTEMMLGGRMSDITSESIARKAGVSKATLYKWWPNKTHLMLDALRHRVAEEVEMPDTGSALEDFVQAMRNFVHIYKDSPLGKVIVQIMAEGLQDPEIMRVFRERFFWRRRAEWHLMWQRGVERGELCPDIEPQLGIDLIYGPAFMRLLSGSAPLNYDDVEAMVRLAFKGLSRP